jgi:hypothetical protein
MDLELEFLRQKERFFAMKLDDAAFGKLDNRKNYEFHTAFRSLVASYPAVRNVVGDAFGRYESLLEIEHDLLGDLDDFDEDVRQHNRTRLNVYNDFRNIVEAHCRDFNPVRKAAALRVRSILDNYGDLTDDDYHVKTGEIYDLIKKLTDDPAGENLVVLDKMDWVEELRRRNDVFDALLKGSPYNEKSERSNRLRVARNGLRKMCVLMGKSVELLGEATENKEFVEFIEKFKELLEEYGVVGEVGDGYTKKR